MLAYLVIREESKWTDVFRLTPGLTVTIGRAPSNQIVVKDERCSRAHAQIFHTQDHWVLRDLDSRNGTFVGDQPVQGEKRLAPGDVIRIAHVQLTFVYDLVQFSGSSWQPKASSTDARGGPSATVALELGAGEDEDNFAEYNAIVHRQGAAKVLAGPTTASISKSSPIIAELCRLAFQLARQPDLASVAKRGIEGVCEATNACAGAIFLAPSGAQSPKRHDLQLIASHTRDASSYYRVSTFLANSVLTDGEAVLARNIREDHTLGSADSKGEIRSTSAICAPIRIDDETRGLLHVYTTGDNVLGPDDLEFTLAVADNVGLAARNLIKQQVLAEDLSRSQTEVIQLRTRLAAESEIVGSSRLMQHVQQQIAMAAPSRATVLIRGESGVGKELVARAVHFASQRAKGPFVCMNCAALTESLLESELFGHEKGSFTGATERKVGKFEAAHQGTLLLDEIGEMSLAIQAKFLRVIEGHPFERVGGNTPIRVDVRVIAATNRDLEKAVTDGQFRRDLYFRLRVVEILAPPLRKRAEDVEDLAHYFLDKFSQETGRRFRGFSPDAMMRLRGHSWPGNVRELKNVIERAVVLSRNERIEVDDVPLASFMTMAEPAVVARPENDYQPITLDELERRHIEATLNATHGNKSRAATILGIERSTLDRKLRRYEQGDDRETV